MYRNSRKRAGFPFMIKAPSLLDDPAHWRRRAAESRSIADQLDDPAQKKTMLEIAECYDRLAARVEHLGGTKK
jgi:hypothetical protein